MSYIIKAVDETGQAKYAGTRLLVEDLYCDNWRTPDLPFPDIAAAQAVATGTAKILNDMDIIFTVIEVPQECTRCGGDIASSGGFQMTDDTDIWCEKCLIEFREAVKAQVRKC